MKGEYILALDQGTSGTKAVIFDTQGRIAAKASTELISYFPKTDFVEQEPLEIYQNVLDALRACLRSFKGEICACGISNQRETFLLWDKKGTPLCRAVVWQCKRSIRVCKNLRDLGIEKEVQAATGLILDPYFSGSKLIWLYENDDQVKDAIDRAEAYFGTVDTWLLYKLTGGKNYYTDHTNASRTLLFNINNLEWDNALLERFRLGSLHLPEPKPSSFHYGETDFNGMLPEPIPIAAMIGDSHASAVGEACFSTGSTKATLGTGSSILLNTGSRRIDSIGGMVTTVCWSIAGQTSYALEGIIVSAGATIQWLRDQLGLFENSVQTEEMAMAVENNNGVFLIPAFSGLGSPYWKMDATAAILNLTFACNKNHIVRAALESIPFQIKDVIEAMELASGTTIKEIKVDGGISGNRFVMQLLADILDAKVTTIGLEEVSALGAAFLAGLEIGVFNDMEQLRSLDLRDRQFSPGANQTANLSSYRVWKETVRRLY